MLLCLQRFLKLHLQRPFIAVLASALTQQNSQCAEMMPKIAETIASDFLVNRQKTYAGGGEGGIRTLGTFDSTPDFESGTFDHSATSPNR